jgi:hypothetical protein
MRTKYLYLRLNRYYHDLHELRVQELLPGGIEAFFYVSPWASLGLVPGLIHSASLWFESMRNSTTRRMDAISYRVLSPTSDIGKLLSAEVLALCTTSPGRFTSSCFGSGASGGFHGIVLCCKGWPGGPWRGITMIG